MRVSVLLAGLLLLAFTTPASAEVAHCSEVTDGGATAVAGLYVGSGGVWTETNNYPGLQTADCYDDNGRDVVADERVL